MSDALDSSSGTVGRDGVSYLDAEPAKKIALLKKAVISLTKQKQALESDNAALTEKLAMLGNALTAAHDVENDLRRQVADMERELARRAAQKPSTDVTPTNNKVGAAALAGVATLKGFLGVGASPQLIPETSPLTTQAPSNVSSSSDDRDRLHEENESLHIQIFELKTQRDQERKAAEMKLKSLERDVAAMQKTAMEVERQRNVLQAQCEQLSAETDELRAQELFCRTFLQLDAKEKPHEEHKNIIVRPATSLLKAEVPLALSQNSAQGMQRLVDAAEALASSVLMVMVSCRECWGERHAAATQHSSLTATRSVEEQQLSAWIVHVASKRDLLVTKMSSLRDLVVREVYDYTFFAHTEIEVLQCLEDMIAPLVQSLPLLVEGSVPLVGRTCAFAVDAELAETSPTDAATVSVSRDALLDLLVHHVRTALMERRGMLRLVQSLLLRRAKSTVFASQAPAWSSLWWDSLVALENIAQRRHLTRDGARGTPVLVAAVHAWSRAVVDQRLKTALESIVRLLTSAAVWRPMRVLFAPEARCQAPLPVVDLGDASRAIEPLLKQVDAAALSYYTQFQHAVVEIAERKAAQERAAAEERRLVAQVAALEDEVRSVSAAYSEQIRLLSDQLTLQNGTSDAR